MTTWMLLFYETPAKRRPVAEYIDSLSAGEAARVVAELTLLARHGTDLGMPHVRHLVGTRLWELRVRGSVHHRVFYIALTGNRLLLLHAFAKKTQATPQRDLATAERRLQHFLRSEPE